MKPVILFINHPEKECGVHQYGENIFYAIQQSHQYDFIYCECSRKEELNGFIAKHRPAAIIYNYYGSTMPWLNTRITRKIRIPHIGIMHEVTQERVNRANKTLFDFHIAPDPTVLLTNPIVFKTGRLIPAYSDNKAVPEKITIGSFGFGTKGKGYTKIIEAVQQEFDEAIIRLNIPYARFGDAEGQGARAYAQACHQLIKKPGIELRITHDFLSQEEVLDFLSSNTINCFFYDENKNRGISSVIDLALAVNKPVAITKSNMFRNIFNATPSVCIEDSTLKNIIANGVTPLLPFKKEWTIENLCWDYDRIAAAALKNFEQQSAVKSGIFALIEKTPARKVFNNFRKIARRSLNRDKLMLAARQSADRKELYAGYNIKTEGLLFKENNFNRILDNKAREEYKDVIKLLCQLCPDEMSRKIPEANIQQAFVFETVRNLAAHFNTPRILSVGCYEDTAYIGLQKLGIKADGIDPVLNYDLSTYLTKPGVIQEKYDIIFSTSVIEHVEDDNKFVNEMANLLKPGGFIVLTCDYKEDYKPGDKIPGVDFRFYTKKDLAFRLPSQMNGCSIFGNFNWDCPKPDFWFEKINYTFAAFVAQKDRS
ncbi:MAG TPA: methyltransferase domain-containing protein [Chitinophagaceae bacterium]|nr:methyltransferase domain-containing protein [Chitinophagaceae bacterium]